MFRRTVAGNTDIWLIEAGRNVLRRLTFDAAREYDAVGSPGGDRIIFNSDRKGVLNLYETSLSGGSTSAETLFLETSEHKNTHRLVGGRAIYSLLRAEPNDRKRPLGPAALR